MDHDLHPQAPGVAPILLPALALLVGAGGYLHLARVAGRHNPARGWSRWRTVSFVGGLGLLAVALLPPIAPWAQTDFRGHMSQHLLIGMYAPLALVLGAPVTLLLRVMPAHRGRRLARVLHSRAARLVAHPATALVASTGSLAVLYFSPIYAALTGQAGGHWLLHAHFLVAGCLFAHAIAGPDPAPGRPGVRARLVYVGCAVALHAGTSQVMYAGLWIDIPAPSAQVQGGAEIMYYGGDIAELLLAAALVATWRPQRRTPRSYEDPSPSLGGAGGGWL